VPPFQIGDGLQNLQEQENASSYHKFHALHFGFTVTTVTTVTTAAPHPLLDASNIDLILQLPQEHTQLWSIAHLITPHTHHCTGQVLDALEQRNGWTAHVKWIRWIVSDISVKANSSLNNVQMFDADRLECNIRRLQRNTSHCSTKSSLCTLCVVLSWKYDVYSSIWQDFFLIHTWKMWVTLQSHTKLDILYRHFP